MSKKLTEDVDLLIDAATRLNKIRELAFDGASTDGGHHKQFFLSQILKIVDKDVWLALDNKGVPP